MQADYADAGHTVVLALYAVVTTNGAPVTGRIAYTMPFAVATNLITTRVSGAPRKLLPNHPLLQDVNTFDGATIVIVYRARVMLISRDITTGGVACYRALLQNLGSGAFGMICFAVSRCSRSILRSTKLFILVGK